MPVGQKLGSVTMCTHTHTHTCMCVLSIRMCIYRFWHARSLMSSQASVAVGLSWENTNRRFYSEYSWGNQGGDREWINTVSAVPGIMLCRLLMCSCVTPLSVHTLSMKRATNRTTELATSLFSESSNPLSVSKLSATLPAMLQTHTMTQWKWERSSHHAQEEIWS